MFNEGGAEHSKMLVLECDLVEKKLRSLFEEQRKFVVFPPSFHYLCPHIHQIIVM